MNKIINWLRNYLISNTPYSIKSLLSKWTAIAMGVVAVLAAIIAFVQAYEEIKEFQDETLINVSHILLQQYKAGHISAPVNFNNKSNSKKLIDERLNSQKYNHHDEEHVPDAKVVIDYSSSESANKVNIPAGFSSYTIDDQEWRVYKAINTDNSYFLIKQPTDIRYEIALNNAMASIFPILILFVFLLVAIQFIIRIVLEPVNQLSKELESRKDNELSPLKQDRLPSEITPFVSATNNMMYKVSNAIDKQQRFIADAAHELRSPLTAISLQVQHIQRLEKHKQSDDFYLELTKLAERIKRNEDLVEQLLSLSKAQHVCVQQNPVNFKEALKQVITTLLPIAQDKHILFDVDGDDLTLLIDQTVLASLLKNIIQNALKYSPQNSTVSINSQLKTVADKTYAKVTISDEGEGIAPEYYDDVLEPFTRLASNEITGSGLGLSIVKRLCDQLGVSIKLSAATPEKGLKVSFEFSQNLLG